ncbi:hypothetical protein GP486_008775, partial [Trichoglossum hirsutum]
MIVLGGGNSDAQLLERLNVLISVFSNSDTAKEHLAEMARLAAEAKASFEQTTEANRQITIKRDAAEKLLLEAETAATEIQAREKAISQSQLALKAKEVALDHEKNNLQQEKAAHLSTLTRRAELIRDTERATAAK